MTEAKRGWRAMPLALRAGLVLDVAYLVAMYACNGDRHVPSANVVLLENGAVMALFAICAVGAWDLARGLRGRSALGARIAAIGWLARLVVFGAWMWAWPTLLRGDSREFWATAHQYALWGAIATSTIGLAIAAWDSHRELAGAVGAVGLLLYPPPFLGRHLWGWLDGTAGYAYLVLVAPVGLAVVWAALAATAARGEAGEEPSRAADGLRSAASALRLRVWAALGMAFFMMIAMTSRGGGGAGAMKFAQVAGPAVNCIAFAWFGLGALAAARGAIADLPRLPLVGAAALSLWCSGVTFAQSYHSYAVLYGGDSRSEDYMHALTVPVALAALAGLALVGGALGAFARRRGDADLARDAAGTGTAVIVLMLISISFQTWMLPEARSEGAAIAILLAAAGAGLASLVLMAKLCTRGATVLASGPQLPRATMI